MIESIRDRLLGYTFDGQFYLNRRRQITGWDDKEAAQAEKLVERELKRLRASFEAVRNGGYTLFIMFLHYPPTNILERRSGFRDTGIRWPCGGITRFPVIVTRKSE